jgi:hypothetical protein
MELNELKFLAAASIFSGFIANPKILKIGIKEVEESVIAAQGIWEEVLKQERED